MTERRLKEKERARQEIGKTCGCIKHMNVEYDFEGLCLAYREVLEPDGGKAN